MLERRSIRADYPIQVETDLYSRLWKSNTSDRLGKSDYLCVRFIWNPSAPSLHGKYRRPAGNKFPRILHIVGQVVLYPLLFIPFAGHCEKKARKLNMFHKK